MVKIYNNRACERAIPRLENLHFPLLKLWMGIKLLCDNKMKTISQSQKNIWWIPVFLGMILGFLFSVRSVFAYYLVYGGNRMSDTPEQCYVSPEQTVVEWKSSTYKERCWRSIAGICVWPIPHRHITYKVTLDAGIPLRTTRGSVIPAINGEEIRNWLTFDSNSWNNIKNNRFGRYEFSDFEPIASNEYVVMVETRYRLFNDVDSTLGICTQSQ